MNLSGICAARLVVLVSLVSPGTALVSAGPPDETAPTPTRESAELAASLLRRGRAADALAMLESLLEKASEDPTLRELRVHALSATGAHREAATAAGWLVEQEPGSAERWDLRGSERFLAGDFAGSLVDFDRAIELDPARARWHWRRGITCYYAGKFEEGRKQFEAYQTADSSDVENAVWRYLCMARVHGEEKARAEILEIGDDRRVPMREIHELFAGRIKKTDVLRAVERDAPNEARLHQRLFYAHLYLGLWHETRGERDLAREHLALATERYRIGHYMWDVARVHHELLEREAKEREAKERAVREAEEAVKESSEG